jgi:hypothetical protein
VGTAAAAAAASSRHSNDSDSYQSAQSRGPSPTESNHSAAMSAHAEGMGAMGAMGAAAGPVIAGAGGPPSPNNVHRVQLDFNPSMDDELGLRSGSLVRLVHEYDDGWVSYISNYLRSMLITLTGALHSPQWLPTRSGSTILLVRTSSRASPTPASWCPRPANYGP